MSARSLLILAAFVASDALAAPAIDPQFGDHAVIQRGAPIRFSGTAAPGEQVAVSFAGALIASLLFVSAAVGPLPLVA